MAAKLSGSKGDCVLKRREESVVKSRGISILVIASRVC